MEQKSKIYKFLEGKLEKIKLNPKPKKFLLSSFFWIYNIGTIILTVFIIRTFIASPFQVYGPSMCDTINYIDNKCVETYGDYLFINKLGYFLGQPQRGDVIVLRTPHNPNEYYIKRIIGISGDTIKIQSGEVYLFNNKNPDGVKLNEPYLNSENQGNTFARSETMDEFTVPEGKYFVLGDNRLHSSDSRSCFKDRSSNKDCNDPTMTPYLNRENIEGKAALVLWPRLALIQDHKFSEIKE